MGRGRTTSLEFCLIDLVFDKAQYIINFRVKGRGRVVVGLDIGSRLVVIDRVFTSFSCMC